MDSHRNRGQRNEFLGVPSWRFSKMLGMLPLFWSSVLACEIVRDRGCDQRFLLSIVVLLFQEISVVPQLPKQCSDMFVRNAEYWIM